MKSFKFYPDTLSIYEELINAGQKDSLARVQARLYVKLINEIFEKIEKNVSTKTDGAEIKNEIKDAKIENTK